MRWIFLSIILVTLLAGCVAVSYERGFKYLLATELQYSLDEKAMEDAKCGGYKDFPYKEVEKER